MKTILNEWKSFLKEEQQITINPADYEGDYPSFRPAFEETVKKSRAFVQAFLDVLVRIELRPLMRSLPEEDRKKFFMHVKMLGHVPDVQFIKDKIKPKIPDDSSLQGVVDEYFLYDLLSYYVSYFTNNQKGKDFVEKRCKTNQDTLSGYIGIFSESILTKYQLYLN